MTKGCYTCRRRRIICDNGQPTCRKCRDAGKECLGYQKPLVWVKGGVASRGKMMGRSFDEVKKPESEPESQPPTESRLSSMSNSNFTAFPAVESFGVDSPSFGTHLTFEESANPTSNHSVFSSIATDSNSLEDPDITSMAHVRRVSPACYLPAPRGLVDPLVKDFSQLSRFYLFHCMIHPFSSHSHTQTDQRMTR